MDKLYRRLYDKTHWWLHYLHKRNAYLSLLNKMEKNLPKKNIHISKATIQEYIQKWKQIDPFPSPRFFQIYSAVNGEVDLNYVPDYLYSFPIDGILSNFRYCSYTENKSLYKHRLNDFSNLLPHTYLNKINGLNFGSEYNLIDDVNDYIRNINEQCLVLKKALDTSSGWDVAFFNKNNNGDFVSDNGFNLLTVMNNMNDCVLQERIKQSEFMERLNRSSVNTFRVVTYRSVTTNKVFVMQVVLKKGKEGSFADNLHSGGLWIPINNSGILSNCGIDESGRYIPHCTGIDVVPYYKDLCNMALSIAEKDWFNRQLFFDFFIDRGERVRLMEINLTSHPTIQLYSGPAFREFTDEVIDYCVNNNGYLVKLIKI